MSHLEAPHDRPATAFDVEACYRLFLARPCEDAETAQAHLADAPGLWTLIERFRGSTEAQRQLIYTGSRMIQRDQDARGVDLAMTQAQAGALTAQVESVWSRYGREDAYYSVLTNPRYRAESLGEADVEDFYATGLAEVERVVSVFRRNEVEPRPDWSVVELGCGLARMGEGLARRFAAYQGVDISAEHLARARRRLDARGVGNAILRLLPEFLAGQDGYDLFYSVIVLQHNPPPIMLRLLDAGLARLNPGGYAYFQLPCFLYDYDFEAGRYLAERGDVETMEMHALPQRRVFDLLARHGMRLLEVTPDGWIGPIGVSYSFLAHKPA